MALIDALKPECIRIGSRADSKDAVLREIAELAAENQALATAGPDTLYHLLREREDLGTTGFGGGIAIPHAALDSLTEFVIGVLVVPDGVPFEALDADPPTVLVFIFGPSNRRNEHVRLLSTALYAVVGFDDGLGIIIFGFAAAIARALLQMDQGQAATGVGSMVLKPLFEVGASLLIGIVAALGPSAHASPLSVPGKRTWTDEIVEGAAAAPGHPRPALVPGAAPAPGDPGPRSSGRRPVLARWAIARRGHGSGVRPFRCRGRRGPAAWPAGWGSRSCFPRSTSWRMCRPRFP